jgi:type VI secretion system FHA domain protein
MGAGKIGSRIQQSVVERTPSRLEAMILTLQVVGEKAEDLDVSRKVFKSIGGTVGRLPDNDWVFADPYISGRHALIRYVDGKYFIEDTSTNGVYLNSHDHRLPRAQAYPLRHGDRLFLDAYEIQVSIESDPAQRRQDPFADPRATPNAMPSAGSPQRTPPMQEEDHTANLIVSDVQEFDDFEEVAAANATQWYGALGHGASAAKLSPAASQTVFDQTTPPQAALHAKPATRPPASAASRTTESSSRATPKSRPRSDDPMQALLDAAGIEGLEADAEAAQVLGEVLRASVSGVMEVLRTRERMKDELRMRGTTFKAANNNPLKFSANVDDAFHNLLVKRNPAYLAPAAAFDDAFKDVRDHQTAFLLAMRLAFESMLAQFDPSRLQEQFDRHLKKGSILGVPAKLRYWDLFRERYGEIVKDADASFRDLFAEEFAKAYEEQLARLKALDRG